MNVVHKDLERLERATARREIAPAELDAEAAKLREAWIALGQLLEAAAPQSPPVARWAVPSQRRPWQWSRATATVLAASLLLGVGATWMWPITGQGRQAMVASHTQHPATPGPSVVAPAVAPAWDDPLDTQITQASDAVARMSQDWNTTDSPFAVIQYELEQTREDVMSSDL